MDVIILTSRYEGLPNVAVEAGIVSRPMVAFDVSGVKEVIDEGLTGYVLRQGDLEGMADKVNYLAQHQDEAEAMGNRARKTIEGLYDLDVMIREKLNFYETITKRMK
jgi:glycosyltransferase involved in cell wall biosynthesis